jgi:hypothetical protein
MTKLPDLAVSYADNLDSKTPQPKSTTLDALVGCEKTQRSYRYAPNIIEGIQVFTDLELKDLSVDTILLKKICLPTRRGCSL